MTNRLNKITTEEDIETFAGGPMLSFDCYARDREDALNKTIKVVNILIEAKLFSKYIGFHDGEMTSDLDKESVAEFMRENIKKDDFIWSMYGDTTVYLPVDSYPGPKRSVDVHGVIDVLAHYTSETVGRVLYIDFMIQSSIWMPFNTKGYPHIDLYALNLNRLGSALVKIEALGLDFVHQSYDCADAKYLASGYLLENLAMDYDCFEDWELDDYCEDDDGIYGVPRLDWRE